MSAQTLTAVVEIAPRVRRWTREEYYRAHALGLFGPEEKLELIRGEIVEKMPQGTPHATATSLAFDALYDIARAADAFVRCQMPVSLLGDSDPEPDLAVARGRANDYRERHPGPTDLLLVVEVSDSTLIYDRTDKARLYAEAGIAEYWVLSVTERLLEVRRDPQGGEYRSLQTVREGETVSPLFATTESLAVADLLPIDF